MASDSPHARYQPKRQIGQYFLIAKSDHPVAITVQMRGALFVALGLLVVYLAVKLHHKLAGRAVEVKDERPDCVLPAELQTA